MIPQQGTMNRWYLRHPTKPGLAWTGSDWAVHKQGAPSQGVQVCNFNSKTHALAYRLQMWDKLPKPMQDLIEAAQRAETASQRPYSAPGGAQ